MKYFLMTLAVSALFLTCCTCKTTEETTIVEQTQVDSDTLVVEQDSLK